MLRAAQGLASELEKETGLATTAGLDDHLLESFVIISTSPRLRKPGQWFEYLQDPEALAILRNIGLMEIRVEISSHDNVTRIRPYVVRLKPSSVGVEGEFVSEDIKLPLPGELGRISTRIREIGERLGFSMS